MQVKHSAVNKTDTRLMLTTCKSAQLRQKIGLLADGTGFIQGQSECLDHRGYGLGWLDPQHQSKKVIYKKVGATTILNLPSMSFVRQNERIKGYMTLYIQSITKHYLLTLKKASVMFIFTLRPSIFFLEKISPDNNKGAS